MGSSSDSSNDDYDRDDDLEDTSSNGGEENDDESSSEEEGNNTNGDDSNYFWYVVYQTCEIKDAEHFFNACAGLMGLYARSKKDVLFQRIMDKTSELEADGMKFEEALAAAVLKHIQAITNKVEICERKSDVGEDEHFEIWCDFAQQDVNPWCKWSTGKNCGCDNCENKSMPKVVAYFAYIFYLIEENDLALEIAEKVEDCHDLYDELIPTVKQYRKDILLKYEIVKDQLSKSDGRLKLPRMLTSLLNYIDENKQQGLINYIVYIGDWYRGKLTAYRGK